MNKILLLLLIAAGANAQQLTCTNGVAQIQQIIPIDGKTAPDIYKLATRWVAKNFHNKDKVIQSTIENELIRGDGYEDKVIKMGLTSAGLKFTFTLDIKDGKMRFTIDNMKSIVAGYAPYDVETYCCKKDGSLKTNYQANGIREDIEKFAARLIESFNKTQNEKGDDW